ncbi:MAG: tryptophan synthase subunit alpha, partial [Hyphomicrobiales bacterium]|nr:tryptophan synthase subunit alpha [Hyphomicrobiales bacterium]
AAAVGTALVAKVAEGLDGDGKAGPGLVDGVLGLVRDLADGVRRARKGEAAQ